MDNTDVNLAHLNTHMSDVRGVGTRVDAAGHAADEGQAFADDAFGLVGQVVAAAAQNWVTQASLLVKQAGTAGHAVADALGDTAKCYRDNEDHCRQGFEAIAGGER
jgi:hypothetical protein